MGEEQGPQSRGGGTEVFDRIRSEFRTALKSLLEHCQSLLSQCGPDDLDEFGEDIGAMKEQVDLCLALAGSEFTVTKIEDGSTNLPQIRHDLINALYIVTEYASDIRSECPKLADTRALAQILSLGRYLDHLVADQLTVENLREVLSGTSRAGDSDKELERLAAARALHDSSAEERGLAGVNLLIVDDDENILEILLRRLGESGEGARIVSASNGRDALNLIEDHDFDAVILDVDMPELDGLETLKRLREHYPRNRLPVIMSTGRSDSSDVVEAFALGANDYLTKPIDLAVAVSRIRNQVDLKRATEELDKRNLFIRSTLGRFLTDEIVDTLLDHPDSLASGGEKRKVTILLSDLRGFTSLSERLPAEQVVEVLNVYFDAMIAVIDQYGGTIDEIIGDALLVIFGAPNRLEDDAERAAACAVAMQRAMASVNDDLKQKGFPAVSMGIGISTGEVVVGVIGSVGRSKYGIIGRQVNLAARIEGCTTGGQILMSEYTRDEIATVSETGLESTVEMKGFARPVRVVNLLGVRGKYRLSLPRKEEHLKKLKTPIRVEFSVLDGKVSSSAIHPGTIERLSPLSAIVESEFVPDPFSNLRLNVVEEESPLSEGDLYAKVREADAVAKSFTLVFTDLPPEVETEIRKRYAEGT